MPVITRFGRQLVLALTLAMPLGGHLLDPSPASAQTVAAPAGEEDEGKPIFGYLIAGAGCIAIIFAISMSARR